MADRTVSPNPDKAKLLPNWVLIEGECQRNQKLNVCQRENTGKVGQRKTILPNNGHKEGVFATIVRMRPLVFLMA